MWTRADTIDAETLRPPRFFSPDPQPDIPPSQAVQHMRSSPGAARDVLSLQRAVGNRAVSTLLQRQAGAPPKVQAKSLRVGPAHDVYEQEADRVADQVMRSPSTPDVSSGSEDLGMRRRSMPPEPGQAQRKPAPIQRRELPGGGGFSPSIGFEQQLSQRRGAGRPLGESTRRDMESRFDADFSGVRVHTGPEAAQLSGDIGARAFTHGADIYFGEPSFNPEASSSQHLLAHELTHTLQQGATTIRRRVDRSAEGSSRIQRQTAGGLLRPGAVPGQTIQRAPWFESMNPVTDITRKDKAKTELPDVPSVAAAATKENDVQFGGHAWVFIAYGSPGAMDYRLVSLNASGADIQISILKLSSEGWANPAKSTTWQVSDAQARAALKAAEKFQGKVEAQDALHDDTTLPEGWFSKGLEQAKRKTTREYRFQSYAFGWRRYNCARFAEMILAEAGVKRSAGWLISTPSQVATGTTQRGRIFGAAWNRVRGR